jgi:hypothetical protein
MIRKQKRWAKKALAATLCGAAAMVMASAGEADAQFLRGRSFSRASSPSTTSPSRTDRDSTRVIRGTVAEAEASVSTAVSSGSTTIVVDPARELMITDLSVVEDSVRTNPPRIISHTLTSRRMATSISIDPSAGKWTFGRLMRDMAGTNDASDFCMQWLQLWETDQTVNGFTSTARTNIRSQVIQPWLDASGGIKLNLNKAPFRLLAIVNRVDLRNNPSYAGTGGNAGEGRFVFGVLGPTGNPLNFTVILEYKLPASTNTEVKQWAQDWHALGSMSFGEAYNDALEAITDRFAGKNADLSKPNGSSIGQIRTNEIGMGPGWQLREFVIDPNTGMLMQTTCKQSPDVSMNNSAQLANWINANESMILAERHTVPANWLAAEDPESFTWMNSPAVTINSADARHKFALNTCSGCHFRETGTGFTMVKVRQAGAEATLAGFITGTTVQDPVTFQARSFDDMSRRVADLKRLLGSNPIELMVEAPAMRTH